MGFFLQLRILLWKNLTLKRRTPLVLMFELFIPLVLFVILLCIRYKQPAYPQADSHNPTLPLPSAGVLAVMQEFCSGHGHADELNFIDFPNSSVYEFLLNFQQIAENNNFFDPGFEPSEMDRIPDLYHRIIDDPALVHDKFIQMQNLELRQFVSNVSELIDELAQNFSLSSAGINAVLSSRLNLTELYRVVFGEASSPDDDDPLKHHRNRREIPTSISNIFSTSYGANRLRKASDTMGINDTPNFKNPTEIFLELLQPLGISGGSSGWILEIIKNNPQLMTDPEMRKLVFGILEAAGRHQLESFLAGYDPEKLAEL